MTSYLENLYPGYPVSDQIDVIDVMPDALNSHSQYKHLYTTLPAPRYLVDYEQYSTEATDQCYYDSGYEVWVRRHS